MTFDEGAILIQQRKEWLWNNSLLTCIKKLSSILTSYYTHTNLKCVINLNIKSRSITFAFYRVSKDSLNRRSKGKTKSKMIIELNQN